MSYEERAAEIKAKLEERDNHIRESWVKAMEVRLVREELEKCQRGEGVNHYENCKWLSEKYLTMLKTNKVQGYKHIDV
ncbi:NADH-ubiquinone oxidoreductase 12 kDa subunit [Tricholoma matsutake]|nr:NADH-ubiquinone oxidoreductase 12 kDa subunit [Tricholoma matsutake 945]